jgi:hypothetical protein
VTCVAQNNITSCANPCVTWHRTTSLVDLHMFAATAASSCSTVQCGTARHTTLQYTASVGHKLPSDSQPGTSPLDLSVLSFHPSPHCWLSLLRYPLGLLQLLYDRDLKMYYPPEDVPCTSRTTTLNEELGQVRWVAVFWRAGAVRGGGGGCPTSLPVGLIIA